jgi:hypothetical protein
MTPQVRHETYQHLFSSAEGMAILDDLGRRALLQLDPMIRLGWLEAVQYIRQQAAAADVIVGRTRTE